jgi:TIR domain-containing protein
MVSLPLDRPREVDQIMRNMLFVSHANPEDNEFSRWLALQLTTAGYPVWCDLTQLLGGEDFWRDAEEAIRRQTSKFLYVLSRASNDKPGPRRELKIASNVQQGDHLSDFIIPLRIDDLPHGEMNIEIARLNAVDFSNNWGTGLRQLLEKLERDQVPSDARFSPQSAAEWWKANVRADQGLLRRRETYISNLLSLRLDPDRVQVYAVDGTPLSIYPTSIPNVEYPAIGSGHSIVAFAEWHEIKESSALMGRNVTSTHSLKLAEFLDPKQASWLGPLSTRRNILFSLFRLAWERFALGRGLARYEMAHGKAAFCFTLNVAGFTMHRFRTSLGWEGRRAFMGFYSVSRPDGPVKRYWHFGLELKPMQIPQWAFAAKYHVAFSDDGNNLWESTIRSQRARRHVCKDWWNAEWRDRLLAALNWLAQEEAEIKLAVGRGTSVLVERNPQLFRSPVAFFDPPRSGEMDLKDDYEEDEDEDEEGRDEQDNQTPGAEQ